MGIYLPNMEMPENCWSCKMFCNCYACEGYYCHCAVLGEDIGTEAEVPRNKRRDDCPLVPVPQHGRLIDADALEQDISESVVFSGRGQNAELIGAKKIISRLHCAPTIILAEGKGYILAPQEDHDGLKRKYVVLKSDTGEVVENCFVLRPNKDKAAIAALLAYADATDNQVLAKDIRAWISTIPAEEGE